MNIEVKNKAGTPFLKCKDVDCQQCNLTLRTEGKTVPLRLMHQRLNHMSEDLIVKMSKLGALDVNVNGKKDVCDVCRTAKVHRNLVLKRIEFSNDQVKPFQRVWTDLKDIASSPRISEGTGTTSRSPAKLHVGRGPAS